ncbi:MAG TPA: hypothetical protein PKM27_00470 [Saprospiraceae bacterium]|nr:hypothetical protein [Saprospiraceae bacterium]HNT19235.1 hypothetical protein [Saprospiraceae bacterium]
MPLFHLFPYRITDTPPNRFSKGRQSSPKPLLFHSIFRWSPPTLVCAGFEWSIAGDKNRNASVELSYWKKGGR